VTDPDPHWALAELDRVMGAERVATWNARTRQPGGEWDTIRALPPRSRRRLVGARWLRRDGLPPDVAATIICDAVGDVRTTCEAMQWYCRTALVAIDEARREAHRDRHARAARRLGARSYYDVRATRAVLAGYPSLWHERVARGWTENRRRDWAKAA
jgi:hypothetical protein